MFLSKLIFNKVVFGGLHVLLCYPCIFWATDAVPFFRTLRKHPLPLDMPYRREIFISQTISGVLSCVLAIWMLPSILYICGGTLRKMTYGLYLYCIIEWGFISLLITVVIMQTLYLPKTYNGCKDYKTWQITDNNTNLFSFIAENQCSKDTCSAKVECHDFVEGWVLSIATLIMFGFAAIFPLLNLLIPWPVVWFYGHVKRVSNTSYAAVKRVAKLTWKILWMQQNRDNLKLHPWRGKRKATLYNVLQHDENSRALSAIAKHLHYSDIISLSMASSSMHRTIFTEAPNPTRTELLKLTACDGGQKSECWCCGIEVCQSCKQNMSLPGPGTESHIENCQPYCSVCYFKVLARRYVSGPGGSETPRTYGYSYPTAPCTCCQTFDERIKWRPLESQERSLCTHCAKLQPSVALSVREAREQAELRHLTKQYLRCVNCDRGLNKEGLKWWGCSACKQECTSDYHMPWDKKHR